MKKYILVTGAYGGIGRALIPKLLVNNYHVIGLDQHCNESLDDVTPIVCDLSKGSDIQRIIDEGKGHWLEKLSGIVHLAGVYPNNSYKEYSLELWNYVMDVNVRSLFWLIHVLYSQKDIDLNLKDIVVVSSTAAKVGSKDPAYAASKAALLGLSKNLSICLKDKKVRVNTILPGLIETQMSESQSYERKNYHIGNTLAGQIGKPEEVAAVIDFLLGDGSSYMWGTEIMVNGGMTF